MLRKWLLSSLLTVFALSLTALTVDVPTGELKRLVLTAKIDGPEWSVGWKTETNYQILNIRRDPNLYDDIRGQEYRLILTDSAGQKLASEKICLKDDSPLSVRLLYTRDNGLSIFGSGQKEFFKSLELSGPVSPSTIEILPGKKCKRIYHSINIDTLPPLKLYDDLNDYPDDPITGIWHKLDIVTPKNGGVLVGGNYEVKIVPDPEKRNCYLIVYLSGADIENNYWQTGAIKARLIPSDFEKHYNVEWIGSDGNPVEDDISATFQGDNLLVIDFPQLESSLRFSRPINE